MTTKSKSHNKHKNKNAGHNKNKKNNNNINNNNNDNKINNNNNNNNYNNFYKCTKIPTYNIRVGEQNFCLTSESLNYDAPNFFTAAFFGYFSESKTTSIIIERDPTYFSMIVRYLRGYQVDWPINDQISMNNLLADVKFYSFGKLQNFLEEIYEKNFPEKVIPWKILTYAPEDDPVVIINIKDVELNRWDSHSLVYDTNPIFIKKSVNEQNGNDNENNDNDNETDNETDNDNDNDNNDNNDVNENNDVEDDTANDATDNADDNDNDVANANNAEDIVEPNADKGLHRLEVHGSGALITVTSNHNNGIKFENFTLKNPAEEETFRVLTKSFRSPDGSFTLSPSLKLPFLKDACIEIDGSKYYTYKELFDYFGVTARGKQLYFEEFVLRIIDGAFLMRARALTIPFYYASQPSF